MPTIAVESYQATLPTVGLLSEEVEDCGAGLSLAQAGFEQLGCSTHWRMLHFEFNLEGLDNLRKELGGIDAMLMFPRMPTWSRLLALNRSGPRPLRSRDFPWGFPGLPEKSAARVDHENTLLRMALDVSRDFLSGPALDADDARKRSFAFLQLEDLGPLPSFLPVSLWQLQELQQLAADFRLHRQAFHQCRHGRSHFARPTGILTNVVLPTGTARNGWPRFNHDSNGLKSYIAPLTRQCGCGKRHTSMRRRHGIFRSPSRSIETGTARLLSAAIAMAEATSQAGRDSLLAAGAEQELLNAITPDVILYTIDDDGYDTDRTVLMDPPDLFEQKSVNQFQNMAQDVRVE